jgi:hypothetical protein
MTVVKALSLKPKLNSTSCSPSEIRVITPIGASTNAAASYASLSTTAWLDDALPFP